MVRKLVHDPLFLAQKSTNATKIDKNIAIDLLDTLMYYSDSCVGMAANMIGINKRIIAINTPIGDLVMINPIILAKNNEYETEESCLSLLGGPRKCRRFDEIKISFQDMDFKQHQGTYTGWTAQIIQHEMDHLDGILI